MANVLLSIDFDFFVPEKPRWDLGHCEDEMFLKMMWTTRGHLIPEMKTDGNEKDFWKRLPWHIPASQDVFVSDSHLLAYHLTKDTDHIVLIDRHHDCFEWPTTKGPFQVDCGNWAAVWLSACAKRKLLWVHPDDLSTDDLEIPVHTCRERILAVPYSRFCKMRLTRDLKCPNLTIHVCRSGCWVPPWLDQDFVNFVKASGLTPQVMQEGVWDPMKHRWNLDDYETARQLTEACRKLRKPEKVVALTKPL